MHEEIRVTVCKYPDRANLVLRYVDPLTGKQQTKSAGTARRSQSDRRRGGMAGRDTHRPLCPTVPHDVGGLPQAIRGQEADGPLRQQPTNLPRRGKQPGALMNPDRLAKLTAAVFSTFQAKLRAEGKREATIGTTLQHLRAAAIVGRQSGHLTRRPQDGNTAALRRSRPSGQRRGV